MYETISLVFFGVTFVLILLELIINRKFAILAFILWMFALDFGLIYYFDPLYYQNNIAIVDNFLLYVVIAMGLIWAIAGLEFGLSFKTKQKQVLCTDTVSTKENDDEKIHYFNLFNIPVAYFNNEKKTYILNKYFRESLGCLSGELEINEYKSYIKAEDITKYGDNLDLDNNSNRYHLKTINGYKLFEENSWKVNNKLIKVVMPGVNKKAENKKPTKSFKDLQRDIEEFTNQQKDYGIILINVFHIYELHGKDIFDKDLKNVVCAKYLENIQKSPFGEVVDIYRLANLEFAILVKETKYFSIIERELNNKTSFLVSQKIQINEQDIIIDNKLGMVFSTSLPVTEDVKPLSIAFNMLEMAASPSFSLDYAIYQGTKDNELNYALKDLGIDLDHDIDNINR